MATQTVVVSGQEFVINRKYRVIKAIGRGAFGAVMYVGEESAFGKALWLLFVDSCGMRTPPPVMAFSAPYPGRVLAYYFHSSLEASRGCPSPCGMGELGD